jgi:Co/Zn/Cd efflux system component
MGSLDLVYICASAFTAVFLLLTVLAIMMRIIIAMFPPKDTTSDSAVIAAIATVASNIYPGTKISNIEELK